MLRPVTNHMIGSDPELFLEQGGTIIGSEKVIPEFGLKGGQSIRPNVVRDGIQVEFNPTARQSVPLLGREISTCFELLERHLQRFPGVRMNFEGLVEVSRAELDSLSEKSRILGCQPSKNIFGERPITVDAKLYRKRSAGGHMHFGLPGKLFGLRQDLIPAFAVFVANMMVMVDRDKGAAERRENYGRAGEFREPAYGVEYRCLSNFWLRNYSLMSLVYGMANVVLAMAQERLNGNDIEQEVIDVIDIGKVVQAIETNDFNLAKENFLRLRPFLAKHLPERGFPIGPSNLDRFLVFAHGVEDHGLESFFPEAPADAWITGKQVEFADFLATIY